MKRSKLPLSFASFAVRTFLLMLLALAACVGSALAQNVAKSAGEHSGAQVSDPAISAQKIASTAPQPASEMQSVTKALAGQWSIKIKFEPSEEMPTGAEGYGEEVWRTGPGGFTFMEEAHDRFPFGEAFLTGFMWWDSIAKQFQGMLCTTQNPHGCDPKGSISDIHLNWDGKQLVVDIDSERNGKKTLWHEVFFDITPVSFTQTGEAAEAGGPLKRVVTIHATKVAEISKTPSK
jgi:hypothetical protein